ncbi:MAG: hypothetical protein ACK4RK_21605 [Gemmataceae bacterium]
MHRRTVASCIAVIGVLLQFGADAGGQPKLNENPAPNKRGEIYVIMKARLYEVDEAFYEKLLAQAKWHSKADIEQLEAKPAPADSLFACLEKQKLLTAGKEVNIDPGKDGVLLTLSKEVNYLPTPEQLQQGKKGPQTIVEGFSFRVQVQISPDRRFVRATCVENSREIEGTEKVKVVVDHEGTEAVGEVVSLKEASLSQVRYIPDGGSLLLPLLSRPGEARDKGRWLVVQIDPRIYIEEEER